VTLESARLEPELRESLRRIDEHARDRMIRGIEDSGTGAEHGSWLLSGCCFLDPAAWMGNVRTDRYSLDRMPGPRRTAHGEASRHKILEAAIELFAERGYAGTALSALCERAGVVKTALYWHFGSKHGLLSAALERAASTWIEQIQKSAYEVAEPGERLDLLVAGLRYHVEEQHQVLSLLLTVTLESARLEPELRESLRRIDEHARDRMIRGIEDSLGRRVPGLDLVWWTTLSLLDGITIVSSST
jgi:AcrR family transcriptional regulator